MNFPKIIRVVEEDAGGESTYLAVVTDDTDLQENGQAIATYERVSIGRVKITKEIV